MPECRVFVDETAMVNDMKTTFFLDIDQTISTGHVGRDLATSVQYYRALGLEIPDRIQVWPDLFQLPEVVRRHEMLPDALAGVMQLSGVGEIAYATVRKPAVEQITRAWLASNGFPSPECVMLCQNMAQKLLALAPYAGALVLIDDRWRAALEVWPRLEEHAPEVAADLRQRLTLVAFGATQANVPESSVVPVIPLPDWRLVADVLMMIHEAVKKG